MTKWLSVHFIKYLHEDQIAEHGGDSGVLHPTVLESVEARPRVRADYDDGASLFDLAASYCHAIVRGHPFVDGNKRTAFAAAATFLLINGFAFQASEPEVIDIMEQAAEGTMAESDLAAWFKERSVALSEST